ncbi:hypothetical protein [Agrilutibacter solisilvae]|uniref:Uncharacterized protein n=1 Tax=Agrilutibacter solisilvae TaxID=2763317 RepID=A0A974Y101_9GAMM|nr:hypothetical protein [Lysobacter solisilvae]QSX79406.1 hypothetical protein I8J32_005965 [Lysobacter solisilvae]
MTTLPAIAVFLSLTVAGQASAAEVWHWQECSDPTMIRATVEADRRGVAELVIPACRLDRAEFAVEQQQRTFDFPAAPAAVRLGAKDAANVTGSIWEAGAEASGLVLGVSFQTSDRILLNSLHVVSVSAGSSAEIAPGIVVRSSVERTRRDDGR